MKSIKKFMLVLITLLWVFITLNSSASNGAAPSFSSYAWNLTNWDEHLYDIGWVSADKDLKKNMLALFSPKAGDWWAIWRVLRYAGMALVFFCILISAIQLITSMGKPEKLKSAITNLLYILIWSLLFFWSIWLFWNILDLWDIQGTGGNNGLSMKLTSKDWLPYFILSLLKWAAFFIAIIYIVSIWFQLMNPSTGESWNGKKLVKKLANVIFALVAIKVVDFLYYIAAQTDFTSQAWLFIIQVAKFLAYISGIVIVFMIIYSWYLLVVDWWKWENFKKAKNTLINIVLAVIALFFFLFILYQIFSEFWGNS